MHKRKQIRDYFETALSGLTTTGANVFQTRTYPLTDAKLPALVLFNGDESSERRSAGAGLQRLFQQVVEGYAKANANVDDTLDAIADEVEAAIDADPTIGGLAATVYLADTEFEFSGDSEKPVGIIRMTFAVEYLT